jgi:hypothetical protein
VKQLGGNVDAIRRRMVGSARMSETIQKSLFPDDRRVIADWLKSCPDGFAKLIITPPPYSPLVKPVWQPKETEKVAQVPKQWLKKEQLCG